MKRLILLLFILLSFCSFSQNYSTKGTEFWFTLLPEEDFNNPSMKYGDVQITSDVTASGTISCPLTGWSQNFNVTPSTPATIDILGAYNPDVIETILDIALKIVADNPVSVHATSFGGGADCGSVLFPVETLGSEYMVTSYFNYKSDYTITINTWTQSQFGVVAIEDNTIVEITPVNNTKSGHLANTPFTVTLNKGQVYTVGGITDNSAWASPPGIDLDKRDMTGSTVKSLNNPPKNFAVFSGNSGTYIGNCNCCADNLYQQMLPVNKWGKEYIIVPYKNINESFIRILAAYDSTAVCVDGNITGVLDSKEYIDTIMFNIPYITSDKPVSVTLFQKSNDSHLSYSFGDPEMTLIHPVSQMQVYTISNFETKYNTIPSNGRYDGCNIITKTAFVNDVYYNGSPIAAQFYALTSNPEYSYAQIDLSTGVQTIECDSGFTGFTYALFGNPGAGQNSCTYWLGGNSLTGNTNDSLNLGPDKTLCVSDTITLAANIDNADYLWSTSATTQAIEVSSSGTYWVQVQKGCFPYSDTIDINIGSPPVINIGNDTNVCINQGSSYNIDAGSGYSGYLWQNGSTVQNISVNTTGMYWVEVSDVNNCSKRDSIYLAIGYTPFADLGIDTCIVSGNLLNLFVSAGFDSYLWQDASSNNTYTVSDSGIYYVQITDTCGTTSDTINIDVCAVSAIWMPNTFTPNGDGLNDVFKPLWISLNEFEMYIYDRWGQEIFHTTDINGGWNGKYQGELCLSGVYIYFINYKDVDSSEKKKKYGCVTLLK